MEGWPPGLVSGASGLRDDLENNFRAVLRANLGKLDLTGRDEFDAQRKVLERTRARLDELERRGGGGGSRAARAPGSRNAGGGWPNSRPGHRDPPAAEVSNASMDAGAPDQGA